jgi:hypothetical protein
LLLQVRCGGLQVRGTLVDPAPLAAQPFVEGGAGEGFCFSHSNQEAEEVITKVFFFVLPAFLF